MAEIYNPADTSGGGDMLIATYDPAGVSEQLVGLTASQALTNKTLTSPAIGGVAQLAENASIGLNPAGSADGKFSGTTITGTGGETIAFGELVYLKAADSEWYLTDADATLTGGVVIVGSAVSSSTDGNPITILLSGVIRADAAFPALTVGSAVYVGVTPGAIQVAAPSGTGDIVKVVGHAITANEVLFNPSPDWIVVS